MDTFDLFIIGLAVVAAVGGYRLGFVGRVASWLGLAAGFYLAVRLLPVLSPHLVSASPGVAVGIAVLLLVGGAMAGLAVGLVVASRLHAAVPFGPLRLADRITGAAVGAIGVVCMLWLFLPAISTIPGWPARAAVGSSISRWVINDLPAPPPALQALRRIISEDAPQVFSSLQGDSAGAVPTSSPLSAGVTAAVLRSTVKVQGQACSRIYEGSGFAVGPDLVATNAHVVAGESPGHTSVLTPSGAQIAATVVVFDPRRDLAILHVNGLQEPALPTRIAGTGATGAVFGHPGGVDRVVVRPARVAQAETAVGPDIYDSTNTRRQILVLAAALAHGDSGGPFVDNAGRVIGVAFAISADHPGTSYALGTVELRAAITELRGNSPVSTGSCLSG